MPEAVAVIKVVLVVHPRHAAVLQLSVSDLRKLGLESLSQDDDLASSHAPAITSVALQVTDFALHDYVCVVG